MAKDTTLRELQEIAEKAQRDRKEAPRVYTVVSADSIIQKDLIRRHAAPFGGQDGRDLPEADRREKGRHYLFIGERDMRIYANRGYAPVQVEGSSGDLVRVDGTDVLVWCPYWIYDDELKANLAASNRMVRDNINSDSANARASKVSTGQETTVVETTGDNLSAAVRDLAAKVDN